MDRRYFFEIISKNIQIIDIQLLYPFPNQLIPLFRTMGRHLVSSDLVMELKAGLRHLPHEVIHQLFQHAFQSIVEYPPPNFTGTCMIIKEQPIRGTDPMKKN